MPYRMDVVDQGRGVVMTREGVVTQAELDESLARELAEPTPLERADYYLTDYRAVERFDVTPEGFRAHALAARALLDRREALAQRYHEALSSHLRCLDLVPGQAHQAFCLHHPRRDALAEALGRAGIASAVYYRYPLHQQPAFADLPRGPLPVSEAASETSLCLPLYPELSDAQQDRVIEAVLRFDA